MNSSHYRRLCLVAAFGSFVSPVLAQSSEAGFIGRRVAGVEYAHTEYTGSRLSRAQGFTIEGHGPVSATFDAGLGYDYADVKGNGASVSAKAIRASLLTYNRNEYGKAYFAAQLGHAWDRINSVAGSVRDDGAFWGVRAGYEVPFAPRSAFDAGIGYTDAFNGGSYRNQTVEFRLAANHWFTPQVAGVASVAYRQIKRLPDASVYTAGLRWAF